MSFSVVILAAGQGTRMKSSLPKVLHTICGRPMIWHIIKEAQKISDDITVILYHQAEIIKEYIQKEFDGIRFVLQDHKNYPGTGGALRNIYFSNEKILVLNGDMPLIQAKTLKNFISIDADIVLSVIRMEDPCGYGRVIIKNDEVEYIVEQKDANEEELAVCNVNAGVYLFKKNLLEQFLPKLTNDNAQKEYYLTDIIALAKQHGFSIKPIFVPKNEFQGVNSKYDLANAEIVMQDRIKRHWMQQGVIMRLPQTIYIEVDVQFQGECELENGVVLRGKTLIENSHIKAHSVVENSTIRYSTIGPFARIRPQSMIQESHIGNFVEVKKSSLNGVKAGHLSYLGDATIDEGTNIGAGTITCNYDGKAKYQTIIGKNVFVGSDTQLIAPVKIEDDVLIAAGTTVTKDIPKGALAISRTPLKIVKDFYYKFFGKN
ncbi:bifunctional UDP-N-acetylglucosamine diphosphorylase/glucosamine-1-phosphate N-acetyltransferase GlmU [Nitratiruptor sp. SB155-2]|uniref:Bifunctional protein GlmU n=1 Tax=Nitratiruptor sp. (strain SB155-2) TaxID=387092 RepID=GLMU_NITSB|nr:bifunctional UDP-N-acetylglucosamine diphosphorylase/glucosamine-1-phosphate N-acetyltransferase GlmU [Nitratiruptor sp. SB155-2]A6Q403.1 RecName: Full=Bifunctional protein GlmU; Includes: RecName: Full=UDP-N-acetylglucosamine pyrophosphorylase; AltName: Full=N-acetylglucosamine-1-phosphate uridyltransferase; Includes: RecName: Full=Glucosamine-1-phosphate N-acetyltransferase [Nitratiruptor sp. SB155-2]BAF70212.1 glucosamine-1-phosphate N-acetyltransferase/UDP-N-acetylglucosamine pyrophosphory